MPVTKPGKGGATSGFAFINVTHPDEIRQRSTQRAIRSGAMAAVGRLKRKRPEKPVVVELDMPQTFQPAGGRDKGHTIGVSETSCPSHAFTAVQRVPIALPNLGMFAIEPDMRARQLLHFLSDEAHQIYRPFRMQWFTMALLSPTSYYLCLANAALFMDQRMSGRISLEYTDSIEATTYYSKCLTRVSRQLTCPAQDIGDGTITTVLGFVCHSSTIGNWNRCEMHMKGLERIIRLRGGFQGLDDFYPFFASWFDIMNSIVQDIPPRFPYPMKIWDNPADLEELSSSLVSLIAALGNTGFSLQLSEDALRKMARLASHVNKHAHQPQFWKSGVESTRLIGPVAHNILSIPRLDLSNDCHNSEFSFMIIVQEAIRLTLLILSAILKRAFSLTAGELGLLSKRFSALAHTMTGLSSFPEIRLWSYLIDACAREDRIPQLHISEIRRAMRDLSIDRIENAIAIAKDIIWVPFLLDRKIEEVARQIDQSLVAV